jgi:hypothetical protein
MKKGKPHFLFKKLKLFYKKESYDFNIQSFIFEKEKSLARTSPAMLYDDIFPL